MDKQTTKFWKLNFLNLVQYFRLFWDKFLPAKWSIPMKIEQRIMSQLALTWFKLFVVDPLSVWVKLRHPLLPNTRLTQFCSVMSSSVAATNGPIGLHCWEGHLSSCLVSNASFTTVCGSSRFESLAQLRVYNWEEKSGNSSSVYMYCAPICSIDYSVHICFETFGFWYFVWT